MHGHVVVISLVAKAGEVACRNGRKPLHLYSYTMSGYGFRLNDNQLIFFFLHFIK